MREPEYIPKLPGSRIRALNHYTIWQHLLWSYYASLIMLGSKTGARRIPQGIYGLVHADINLLLSLELILKVSDGREKIS